MPVKKNKTRKKLAQKNPKKKSISVSNVTKKKAKKSVGPKKKPGNQIIKTEKKKRVKRVEQVNRKNVEKILYQEDKPMDIIEKFVPAQDSQSNNDTIFPMVISGSSISFVSKRNHITIISLLFIFAFFMGGYIYPASLDDVVSNNVIWAGNDGQYDRGLFGQFYASIAFTMGVFLLGYYVNATFIKYNIKDWNYFSIGVLLMFLFGLGRIGELVFDHNIFEGFKNIVLPFALIVLTFAIYRIFKNMTGAM
ncbi:MAG: hypothetical protein OIN87_08770 [Candidatus Methanoperedens sp.]|nr:hypothetical protein [Candidatus Methanoperedens sp.]